MSEELISALQVIARHILTTLEVPLEVQDMACEVLIRDLMNAEEVLPGDYPAALVAVQYTALRLWNMYVEEHTRWN